MYWPTRSLSDLTGAHQRFYDRWLSRPEAPRPGTAPVRIFVMGIDQWRDEQDWPLPDTTYADLPPAQLGAARTAPPATANCAPSAPRRRARLTPTSTTRCAPFPTLGGSGDEPVHGPTRPALVHQRPVRARADVLCYSTPVLDLAGRGHRPRVADPVRLVVGARHRLHRQAGRRPSPTAAPSSSPTGSCAPATGTRSPRPSPSTPGEVYEVTPRPLCGGPTCSCPATGSAWKSPAATSRATTATPTPGAPSPRTPTRTSRWPSTASSTARPPSPPRSPIIDR